MRPAARTPGTRTVSNIPNDSIRAFERGFQGEVILPGDERYDRARRVWNGLVNEYPAIVARCRGVSDVASAVEFAREHDLPVGVRGGGHHVTGGGVSDGSLVVDLSGMKGIRVDPANRTARVEPGVRVGELLAETQRFGLAASGGTASDTGIAGSTLGGGIGWLRRKHGLAIDNLLSVDLVTADGELVTASETENEDLFWGVRGAGGHLGVVTSFEFRLQPVGPEVATVMVYYPGEAATDVLRDYREYTETAPDEVTTMAFLTTAPDSEAIPREARGKSALGMMACYAGQVEKGTETLQPLRELADPLADFSGPTSFIDFHESEGMYPSGRHYYWKSVFLEELSDECIERLVEHACRAPSRRSSLTLWQFGGAMSRVASSETAFAGRDEAFMLSVEVCWDDPVASGENVAWGRTAWEEMRRFSSGRLYINFVGLGEEGSELSRAAYGDNYDRLVELKAEYDPTNTFRINRNVGLTD